MACSNLEQLVKPKISTNERVFISELFLEHYDENSMFIATDDDNNQNSISQKCKSPNKVKVKEKVK